MEDSAKKQLDEEKMVNDAFQHLINTYLASRHRKKVEIITKAFNFAKPAHKGVRRLSGEPYIMHPLAVAQIVCSEIGLGSTSICAALLHDVVEDTDYTVEDVSNIFGPKIAQIVDGLTKISGGIFGDKASAQAESFKKLLLTMSDDIRVILIKISDRLHNMRTLGSQPPNKQYKIAGETLYIYAPLANRLGLNKIKEELEDLSFRYEHPEEYQQIIDKLAQTRAHRETLFEDFTRPIREALDKMGLTYTIKARIKTPYSIWCKMQNKHIEFEEVYDILAVRIIFEPQRAEDEISECFRIYVCASRIYKPHPERLRDWLTHPKANGYQALHVTLMSKTGQWIEVQIRSTRMDEMAEQGFAAHWKYKENNNTKGLNKEEEKLSWLREVLEWQRDMDDNKEFLSLLKTNLDLFAEQVYCFTPNGDVKNLANGSTPIDFAYSIHSAVGNKMVGARVNGRQVPFDYHLQNGDRVEIITSQISKGPSRDWLVIGNSAQARSKINQWFKRQFKEENIVRGKELLEKYCKSKSIRLPDLMKPEYIKKVELKYGFKDWDSVCAAVGHGGLKEGQVINKMQEEDRKIQKLKITDEQILQKTTEAAQAAAANPEKKKDEKSKGGIVVRGANDVAVRFSKCCNPVPGDEIVGFITRGRGISIHRTDCVNLLNMPESDRARLIEAEWQVSEADTTQTYTTEINIYANNRKGLLAEVSKIFLELDIDIITINVSNNKKGRATLSMSFDITGVEQLNRIITKIRNVEGVIDIERTAG